MKKLFTLLLCAMLLIGAGSALSEESPLPIATIGQETGAGYRITAAAAAVVCVLGGALFMVYNEKRVYGKIMKG